MNVIVPGTFDCFHEGHKKLIDYAWLLSGKTKVTIAINSRYISYLNKKQFRDYIEERAEKIREYALCNNIIVDIFTIHKPEDTIGFGTALYDATYESAGSVLDYAKLLDDQADITSNGIVFIVTDGMDNQSSSTPTSIVEKVKESKRFEVIESLKIILIGINDPDSGYSSHVTKALSNFHSEAELDQFVDAGDATPEKIAKISDFVSKSISSQSQSLGTGGQSVNLTF